MAFSAARPTGVPAFIAPQADINVTPLVDVMLVLLIIFMVTAPLLAAGIKVDLPQAKAAQPLDPKEPIVVVVGKDGKVALGADASIPPISWRWSSAKMGDDPSRVVHLRGDKEAPMARSWRDGPVGANGITHIAMVTEKKKRQSQPATAASDLRRSAGAGK